MRLTSQAILRLNRSRDIFVCQKCVSVRLFTVKNLLFPKNYTFEFILHGGEPTMNKFFRSFPADRCDRCIKDWFQFRKLIAR